MLDVIMLNVAMLCGIMPNVAMLSAIMLNVVAPLRGVNPTEIFGVIFPTIFFMSCCGLTYLADSLKNFQTFWIIFIRVFKNIF